MVTADRLTAKQEHFAQLLLDPEHSQASAYQAAYDVSEESDIAGVYVCASRLAGSLKIKLRVQELKEAIYAGSPYTPDRLRARLELRSDESAEAGQFGPSVRALEMIGKLDGLIVDRRELNVSGVVGHVELSTEELRQLVEDGRRIATEYQLSEPKVIEALPASETRLED